nr:immunoglobulin light chain junction region [Macaca mulatta]
CQQHCNYPFTF